jgi:uncharacterized protein YeaO (DUF488 family)
VTQTTGPAGAARAPAARIGSKRWNDPVGPDDGTRVLVCLFRPRGVPKSAETWSEWHKELAPSPGLHAAWYGKLGIELSFADYRRRFLEEMAERQGYIEELARRVARGERLTLLCSSACTDPRHCHRTLLIELIEQALQRPR